MKNITKTVFKVGDFVSWMQTGHLQLSPRFQRRSVWKEGAKSFLIDTMVRGMPVPIVFLRDRVTVGSVTSSREVVDGQQRLRTIVGFIDPNLLVDPQASDTFTISKTHNKDLSGKRFAELPPDVQQSIIGYEIPVHVFPSNTEDRDVLQIFARLNATGVRVNRQELRNADWYGVFKSLMFELGYQYLAEWESWKLFRPDEISRMKEVEEVSDLVISMHEGVHGKTQDKIDLYYKQFDEKYSEKSETRKRFDHVIEAIKAAVGSRIKESVYSKQSMFHALFVATYELTYGLKSSLSNGVKPKRLPSGFAQGLLDVSARISKGRIPKDVRKSLQGAVTDVGSRVLRVNFILDKFGRAVEAGK